MCGAQAAARAPERSGARGRVDDRHQPSAAPQPAGKHRDLREGRFRAAPPRGLPVARSDPMTTFTQHVEDYLQLRRALGFKLDEHARLLAKFAVHLDSIGAEFVTIDAALAWRRLWSGSWPSVGARVTSPGCRRRGSGRCWGISTGWGCFQRARMSARRLIGCLTSFVVICWRSARSRPGRSGCMGRSRACSWKSAQSRSTLIWPACRVWKATRSCCTSRVDAGGRRR